MKRALFISLAFLSLFSLDAVAEGRKVYKIDEILAARVSESKAPEAKYCSGGAFKPCVCPSRVTKLVQYRPSVKECNGRAAVILSGKYLNVYSVVVRDFENKDRSPPEGINGCTPFQRDVQGLNKCSAFKVQKVIPVENADGDAEVHCLGASGYSVLFKKVRRITAKLQDIPGTNTDPLVRLCLVGPTEPLN